MVEIFTDSLKNKCRRLIIDKSCININFNIFNTDFEKLCIVYKQDDIPHELITSFENIEQVLDLNVPIKLYIRVYNSPTSNIDYDSRNASRSGSYPLNSLLSSLKL